MRQRTETTTLRISEGTPERSMMVIGRPCTGIRKIREMIWDMLSRRATEPNMKEKRESACSAFSRALSRI